MGMRSTKNGMLVKKQGATRDPPYVHRYVHCLSRSDSWREGLLGDPPLTMLRHLLSGASSISHGASSHFTSLLQRQPTTTQISIEDQHLAKSERA